MNAESESVEFKPSLSQHRDIVESVSAFSNTSGGKIVIGMDDEGKVLARISGEEHWKILRTR